MASAAEIGGKFTIDIEDLKAGITEANRLMKLADSEFKATSASMGDWTQSAEGLEAKQNQLNTVIDIQRKKIEALQQEHDRVAEAQGEASAAAVNLQNRINNETAAMEKNKRSLDDVDTALDELKNGAGTAGNSMNDLGDAADDAAASADEVGEGYTVLKDVLADYLKQALDAVIDGFKELALESEKSLDLLQAKTGATSAEMEGIGDTAQAVFKNGFGGSLDDVTEAMGTILNMTGDLNNADLQKITENTMTLADVYGWDIQESMRAANSLMNQFGITSDEAFNLMTQGAQAGLDQNDDLLDTINEYSVQFANAGFSANDMFNMLANGAASGTWSVDKLGDAVKEYNIRWNDGTAAEALQKLGYNADEMSAKMSAGGEEGARAMQAVMMSLSGVEDEQERYMLGQQLMGTMWEDLGEDAVMSLMNTKGAIDSTNDSMGQVKSDAYDNLSTSLTTLGRTLKQDILQPIVDTIAPAVTSFVNWCIDHMSIVTPIVVGLGTAFGVLAGALMISNIISAVQKAMALLNVTMLANPFVLIVTAIAGLVAAFIYLWNTSEGFRNFFINLWDNIKSAVSNAITAVVGFFQNLPETISGWLSKAIDKVKEFAINMGTKGVEAGKKLLTSVVNAITGLPGKLASIALNAIASLASKLGITGKVVAAAQKILNAVVNKMREIPGKMLSIGGDIVRGIWNGINDKIGWIGNQLSKFKNAVMKKLKSVFGINSPSKLMRDEIGVYLAEGIGVGFQKAIPGVIDDMDAALKPVSGIGMDVSGSGAAAAATPAINFTQNNYSPKALSPYEIYRQTQIANKLITVR